MYLVELIGQVLRSEEQWMEFLRNHRIFGEEARFCERECIWRGHDI